MTGAAGFIGSHIVDALIDAGLEVVAVDDLSSGTVANLAHLEGRPGFTFARCDIADERAFAPLFDGVDSVFHNAACKKTLSLLQPTRDVDTNVRGALNVALLSKAHGVKKIVVASTGSVYGEAVQLPQTETHPLNPVSIYGIDKLAGESLVRLLAREAGIDATILRYFHVYGERQHGGQYGGVIAIFSEHLLRGEAPTIHGDGFQQRSFTYVGDVVAANLLVALHPGAAGETFNCASGLKITIGDMYARLAALAGRADLAPRYGDWTPGDIKTFDVSNAKISALGLPGWTPFDEGLRRTFDWFRSQHAGG